MLALLSKGFFFFFNIRSWVEILSSVPFYSYNDGLGLSLLVIYNVALWLKTQQNFLK